MLKAKGTKGTLQKETSQGGNVGFAGFCAISQVMVNSMEENR